MPSLVKCISSVRSVYLVAVFPNGLTLREVALPGMMTCLRNPLRIRFVELKVWISLTISDGLSHLRPKYTSHHKLPPLRHAYDFAAARAGYITKIEEVAGGDEVLARVCEAGLAPYDREILRTPKKNDSGL